MYGEILKNLRLEKGLTQQQLAEILGFKSASAVGMVEREERELSVDKIISVADYFKVSSDYLMGIVPFRTGNEAYHSICVASIKYLRDNPHAFPYDLKDYIDYDAVFRFMLTEEIEAYFDNLITKYKQKIYLTDLELFELSTILFLSIDWSSDYSGLVYFKPFNKKYAPFSIALDFNKIDKITLDLNKLIFGNLEAGYNTYAKHVSILNTSSTEFDSLEGVSTVPKDNQKDLNKGFKNIELLEDFGDAEQALKFILSQPVLAAYGGYDLKNMPDEEIIEIANDMLFAMRLSLEKLRKKNK